MTERIASLRLRWFCGRKRESSSFKSLRISLSGLSRNVASVLVLDVATGVNQWNEMVVGGECLAIVWMVALRARTVVFPHGLPGPIGLILTLFSLHIGFFQSDIASVVKYSLDAVMGFVFLMDLLPIL